MNHDMKIWGDAPKAGLAGYKHDLVETKCSEQQAKDGYYAPQL